MIDINDIAALLHVEEKLRGHPQFKAMYAAVMAKLNAYEAEHKAEEPKPEEPEVEVEETETEQEEANDRREV